MISVKTLTNGSTTRNKVKMRNKQKDLKQKRETTMKTFITAMLMSIIGMTTQAADIEVEETVNGYVVTYIGTVEQGDAIKLDAILTQTGVKTIAFWSPGGNAMEGYELAGVLSKHDMAVWVPRGSICLSACATAFIGGKDYRVEGQLGFHVAWTEAEITTNESSKTGQILGTRDTIHFVANGFSIYLPLMIAVYTTKDDLLILDQESLEAYFVRTDGANDPLAAYLEYGVEVTPEFVMPRVKSSEQIAQDSVAQRQ